MPGSFRRLHSRLASLACVAAFGAQLTCGSAGGSHPLAASSIPVATPTSPVPAHAMPPEHLTRFVAATDPNVAIMGRTDRSDPQSIRSGYPGVTIRVAFSGSRLRMCATCSSPDCRLLVLVDEKAPVIVRMPQGSSELTLAAELAAGGHHVDIVRRTECWQGILEVSGFLLDADAELLTPKAWPRRKLMFIGDSVTCGEGVDRISSGPTSNKAASSDAYGSYGMVLARALDAQCHLVCFGGRGLVRDWQGKRDVLNAPQFFEFAIPEEPYNSWNHASYVPDGIFISLGTNDFNLKLGAFPTEEEFVSAYVAFLRRLRSLYPSAQIVLTEGAIVNDKSSAQKGVLRSYIDETLRQMPDPKLHAVPSTHYPGDASNAHPTAEQHVLMAHELEPVLRKLLGW
jgi:hypothetical protein